MARIRDCRHPHGAPDSARLAAESILRIDPADRNAWAILEYLDRPGASE